MPKGPKVSREVDQCIAGLVSHNPELQASQIETALIKQFAKSGVPIPSIRTIQQRAQRVRVRLSIQEKPWSIAAMIQLKDDGIPWKAVEFIMQSFIEIEGMIKSGKESIQQVWKYTGDFFTQMDEDAVIKGNRQTCIMTNRQAKWLWRLHLIFPGLKLQDLLGHVDTYVQRELFADYLGWELNTSDLDNGLMNIQHSVLTHGYYADRGGANEGTPKKTQ